MPVTKSVPNLCKLELFEGEVTKPTDGPSAEKVLRKGMQR